MAACGTDGAVHFWDAYTGRSAHDPVFAGQGRTTALAVLNGRSLLAGTVNGIFRCELSRGYAKPQLVIGRSGDVASLASIPDDQGSPLLAICGPEGTVRIVDLNTRKQLRRRQSHAPSAERVAAIAAFAVPDGQTLLVTSGARGRIWITDPITGLPFTTLRTDRTTAVRALAMLPRPGGDSVLLAGCVDGTVELWNPVTGQLLSTVPVGRPVNGVAVIDSAHIAVSTHDGIAVLSISRQVW